MAIDNKNVDLSALKINRDIPSEPQGSKSKYIVFGVLILALFAAYYFLKDQSFSFQAEEVEVATAIMTSPSQANAILTSSGYVVAQRKASISSKATGRLENLYVIEGDVVKAGSIIGRIESNDVNANLQNANASLEVSKANLQNATAELEDAKISYDRQRKLSQSGANTTADLTTSESRVKRAEASVAAAQAGIKVSDANIRAAQVQVENTVIRAPFDGTVLNKNANVGEVITALGGAVGSRGAVVTIADMTSLEVEADVSESNIERIKPDMQCEITLDAFPEKRYRGSVSKIIPTADRAKATVLTKIKFTERDDRVLPEMSAKVLFLKDNLSTENESAPSKLTVPAASILSKNGKKVVFVMKNDLVTEVAIQVGDPIGGSLEVLSGLTAGDKVILNPTEKLSTGTAVKLKK
ncbi:MAG: efflux RND transporter periplasmic adaptor subunit [Ignavibacteria bacterium]|nr:efflux RND transporter periplasmic adaptor subunit [Ignavibacteria bacterium]